MGQPARAGQTVCTGVRGRLGEGGGIKPNAPRFPFRVSSSPSWLSCVICYCQGRGDTTTPPPTLNSCYCGVQTGLDLGI